MVFVQWQRIFQTRTATSEKLYGILKDNGPLRLKAAYCAVMVQIVLYTPRYIYILYSQNEALKWSERSCLYPLYH